LIYVLFGADDFSLRKRLEEIKSRLGDKESLALNTTFFDSQQLSLSELVNACDTVPFLGTNRLIVVQGLLGRIERKEGKNHPAFDQWEALSDYAASIPASTILILIDGENNKANPLLKSLSPLSEVEEFPVMKGANLQQWIHSQLAKYGGKMSPQAMRLLTELAGEDLWVLSNEIEKLCLYAQGRRIEEEDVRLLTALVREANIFAMIDAFAEKRGSTAMQILHQLLDEGTAPTHILSMLTRQLRLMVQAKELDKRGSATTDQRKQLGVSPRYPIEKLFRQSARYPLPRLVQIYQKLLDTDLSIKTGKWKDQLALDLLVAEVCS